MIIYFVDTEFDAGSSAYLFGRPVDDSNDDISYRKLGWSGHELRIVHQSDEYADQNFMPGSQ